MREGSRCPGWAVHAGFSALADGHCKPWGPDTQDCRCDWMQISPPHSKYLTRSPESVLQTATALVCFPAPPSFWKEDPNFLLESVGDFLVVTIIKFHLIGDSKQHRLRILQFRNSEVQKGSHLAKMKVSTGLCWCGMSFLDLFSF